MTTHRVFVYGTLLSGEPNHRLLSGARLIRRAKTPARYRFASLGPFPGMARGGRVSVHGEVYEVTSAELADLDRLEGHPRFYKRQVIRLSDDDEVLAYLLEQRQIEGRPTIPSGDWRQAAEEQRT